MSDGRTTHHNAAKCSAPKCRNKAAYVWKDGKLAYCGECFSAAIAYTNVTTRMVAA